MNLIVLVIIMGLAALTATSNSDSVALESLCVLDAYSTCWIDKAAGEKRDPQPGDYVISPEDLNRLLDRLKNK